MQSHILFCLHLIMTSETEKVCRSVNSKTKLEMRLHSRNGCFNFPCACQQPAVSALSGLRVLSERRRMCLRRQESFSCFSSCFFQLSANQHHCLSVISLKFVALKEMRHIFSSFSFTFLLQTTNTVHAHRPHYSIYKKYNITRYAAIAKQLGKPVYESKTVMRTVSVHLSIPVAESPIGPTVSI